MLKYIFVTGGVVSGLGKGITAASLGRLLANRGLKVGIQKIDGYLNVDPGTMSPYEHGEVFITDDGAETDLDLGHYERFLGKSFHQKNVCTMGRIYDTIIKKERAGDYLGKTIQVVPHVTNEIKNVMRSVAEDNDIVIVEVGGTVGDIESATYVEAIRQFRKELGPKNSLLIHVTLVPYLDCSGEIKTRPTQYSVHDLQRMGVTADIVVVRTNSGIMLDKSVREKIAMFCNLDAAEDVIHNRDCKSIYEVPIVLKEQNLDEIVLKKLGVDAKSDNLTEWRKMVTNLLTDRPRKTIAIVGKYTLVPDAYLSIIESVKHAGIACGRGVEIKLVDAERVEKNGVQKEIGQVDAIIVPGGFGERGIEGKIAAVKYARENNIPFLGICLGLQMAVIEFARNVLKMAGANSTEINPKTPYPIIDIMESQKTTTEKGGTMRLGLYDCKIAKGTKAAKYYKKESIQERHRHRYEVNHAFRADLERGGLVISGVNPKLDLVEIIELPAHPYFVAAQFHPEFLSRPYLPHPLFVGLIDSIK